MARALNSKASNLDLIATLQDTGEMEEPDKLEPMAKTRMMGVRHLSQVQSLKEHQETQLWR